MALDADLNMTIETLRTWTVVPSWMSKIDSLSPELRKQCEMEKPLHTHPVSSGREEYIVP